MAGPRGNRTRYDLDAGAAGLAGFRGAMPTFQQAETPRWSAGFGRGDAYNTFAAAFDDYRREVNERLTEQQRVGGLVVAMAAGIHQRFGLGA